MRESTHKNLAYGTHERNVIDLYLVESDTPAPLYVFIHGGGFREGIRAEFLRFCWKL